MKGNRYLTIFGLIISIILLYLSLRGLRYEEIIGTLRRINIWVMPFGLMLIFSALSFSALKWSRIAGNKVNFFAAFISLLIGLFVNNVMPARIGEVARGYVLSKKTDISLSYALSTVFVDRFFDLVGLLLILFIFFPKQVLPANVSHGIYMLVALLIVCIFTIVIVSREGFSGSMAARLERSKRPILNRLALRVNEIKENFRRINSLSNLITFSIVAFMQWLSMSLALYLVILGLGIKINLLYVPFVCSLLNMGLTIPSSPGYIGMYQFLLIYLLSIFYVPKNEGFAVSVIYHALWYIPYSIMGFVFLLKEHIKIREIKRLKDKEGGLHYT